MSDLQIAVIAYNRPKYLHVMLDSLFAVRGIENHRVSIHVDGGIGLSVYWDHMANFVGFPVDLLVTHSENRGILQNVIGAIKHCFDDGASEVVYVEEDVILRPDTLEYLARVPRDVQFYSLFGNGNRKDNVYCPVGNLVGRETFPGLYDWVKDKRYAGRTRPGFDYPLSAETRSHDAVFYSFMVEYGLETLFPDRSYTAHFGLIGVNSGNPSEPDLALQRYMFSGEMKTWLPRIIRLIQGEDEVPEGATATQFMPSHFRYED